MTAVVDQSDRRPYSDLCPECTAIVVLPESMLRSGVRVTCSYRCLCGHSWVTCWDPGAVEGRDAA